jgi:uncharacterized protein YeaO (DUF488 family)
MIGAAKREYPIMAFRIKRAYEPANADDGLRILVDRLWPRGLRKVSAALNCWMKDVAPSTGLRKWFDHRPERFAEFAKRYRKELSGTAALAELKRLGKRDRVSLLYGARDPRINHAAVLLSILEKRA